MTFPTMTVPELIRESLRIEDIRRSPLRKEVEAWEDFMALDTPRLADFENFVHVYQRNAKLRDMPVPEKHDVWIGEPWPYRPPPAGPQIREQLEKMIAHYVAEFKDGGGPGSAMICYIEFESLHPFTDCNGRMGRMFWYWMMRQKGIAFDIGFLRCFHIQTIDHIRKARL